MGIQGLLPLLKSIMNPIHIKELEGCFVAVDTYSWLHKGALSCSTELCKGLPTTKHINYCMHRVNLLRHYGVKPILVFDGGPLPMKSEQEIKRERSRKENHSRAMEHESNGNLRAAYEFYQKAVDITPSIAHDLVQVLKQENVSYVVAPYEADAQMTFLAITKHVEAVITEDSDLIAFGCPRIIYKMDKFGQGVEFKNTMLQHNKELDLSGFTQTMLLEMCILSGCDYLQSLPGMGLKKAHALIKKFISHDKVIKHLKYNSIEIAPDYEESFKRAILTFRHQRVYDPESENIVHLTEPPADCGDDDLDFLGPLLPQHVATGVAQGDLDPFTKAPMQEQPISAEKLVSRTYHAKAFKPTGEKKKLDLPVQKNLVTNYFCSASLEAKRNFKAPRITPMHGNDKSGTSQPVIDVRKGKRVTSIDDLAYRDVPDHGASEEERLGDYLEMQPLCKPCTSLHKDIELDGKSRKPESENKHVVVRSRYFLKKSIEEDGKENKSDIDMKSDDKFENVISNKEYKLFSSLLEGTCRKEEKRPTTIRSSYFQQNIMHDCNSQRETENKRINSIRSSCDEETSLSEHDDPESEDLVISSGDVTENSGYNSRSFSGNNSSEFAIKKRKLSPTLSQVVQEDTNDMNLISSGTCSSDIKEDTDTKEVQKFGCNISHLDSYSNIAEKSMDKFVSVISSFRYNSTGSRASGLRAPLKEIKNNRMTSLKPDVDLAKFAYKPTSENPSSRSAKFKI